MKCLKFFVEEKLNAYSINFFLKTKLFILIFILFRAIIFDYYIKYIITKVNNMYLQYNIYVK